MKLYYSPGACSLAPHILLEEIGAPFDLELVSTSDGSTRSSDFLDLNPKGRVPVLRDEAVMLTEVSAISTYLVARHPDLSLIANDALPRARTYEWMSWLGSIHATSIAQIWRTERFTADEAAHDGIRRQGRSSLIASYALIDDRLAGSRWAAGEAYSIADPYLLLFFRWGHRLGVPMDRFKSWQRHAADMEGCDAVKRALETEDISLRE